MTAVISGVGLWTPPHSISNAELVASYNAWADRFNAQHDSAIARGDVEPKQIPHYGKNQDLVLFLCSKHLALVLNRLQIFPYYQH